MTTWPQDSVVISGDKAIMGTPQRRSRRKVSRNANDAMKSQLRHHRGRCKSGVGGAPKRQAVGWPQVGDFDSTDAMYIPRSDSGTSETDDGVLWLQFGEEGAPNTCNHFACVQEMERAQRMCVDVRKMCKKFERSLAIGMHWIMQGWRLKTRILETMRFPEKHTTTNICGSLPKASTSFAVCSKSADGKIPQCEEAMSSDKLASLARKPTLDAPLLMSDCGSDVSMGAEKDNLLDCNHCACPCLSIAAQVAMKSRAIEKFLVRLFSQTKVKAEQEIILHNWLMGENDVAKKLGDHSSTTVLAWWSKQERAPPEIVDWARRRLCVKASSATSERAFSKAGLITRKKRQRLTADDVDNISLLGWHYKDNGWGESGKRPRCVPHVEGERLEEESQMVAQ